LPPTSNSSTLTRRAVIGAFGLAALPLPAQVAEYPQRPIRLVVPAPPGGPMDLAARALAEPLRAELGQAVVIENRAGAAGMLGTGTVAQATPDGYTLAISAPSSQITAPLLIDKPPFNGARDFTPIGQFARFGGVLLVNAAMPVQDMKQLVALVLKYPGKFNYGSPGQGSNPHLLGELLKSRTKMHLVHIPYKGGAPALQALLNDEIQVYFDAVSSAMPWIRAGRVRPIAVVSGQRLPVLPDVPTLIEEKVFDAPADFWIGIAGPKGMPGPVVSRLNEALRKAARHPDMLQFLTRVAGEPAPGTPEALQALWIAEQQRWGALISANKIRAD
jgi:tripartite-type tricarboxylate transporter receptor subunit TctC